MKSMAVRQPVSLKAFAVPLLVVLCLSFIRWQYGVLLFHTLAELFSVMVGILMLVIVWNTRRFTRNDFLLYLGIGYFWIAVLDTWHTFTVEGIPFFDIVDSEITLHFWISTRLIEALLLLSALLFLKRRLNANLMFFAGAGLASLVTWASFALKQPVMLTSGGLTPFKVNTEYLIIALLAVAAVIYIMKRELLASRVLYFLLTSIVLTIFAELSFTLYTDFHGEPFVIGHLLKFLSFWMIYQAIVQTTLNEPFTVMALASSSYDAIPHPAVVVDNQGVISQVNRAAEKSSGKSAQQLVHQPVHQFFHSPNVAAENCELCQAIRQSRPMEGWIVSLPEKDRWFLVSLAPIRVGDKSSGMVQSLTDISDQIRVSQYLEQEVAERKKTEQELAQSRAFLDGVINGVADPIFVKDEKHRWIVLNDAICQMLGESRTELLGKSDYDLFPKEQADIFWAHDDQVMSSDEVDINEEQLTGAGETRTISTSKSSFINPTTGKKNLVGTIRDITEQKKVEEALRRTQKMDAIGQLTGGIAHDFNNILSIILGNLSFLQRLVADDEKALKRVETVNKAALRATDLTKQLLGFSRKQAQNSISTNINPVIQGMDSLIVRSITPEVEVDHHLADNLWLTDIDPGDFEDALLNLVLNARDAMPGSGRLTIETSNTTLDSAYAEVNPGVAPGEYVQLVVSDTGCGIPAETLDRIFEPFFTTKPEGKGTGLGMSMVFGFAQRSGGHVKAYSEHGIGTTIRLYLPRYTGVAEESVLHDDEGIRLPQGRETVLVVDDEEDLLELAQHYLEELGYTAVTAMSGQQALERLTNNSSIDLLFSDVVMPGGMNGYELAEQARIMCPQIKVLLTSGFTNKAVARNGQARFTANLLSKPYNQADMARRVRLVLDEKGRGRES